MRFYKIEAAVKTEAIPERARGRQRENYFNFEEKCGLCTVKEDDGKIIFFGIVTGGCTIEALLQSYYEKDREALNKYVHTIHRCIFRPDCVKNS